MPKHNNPSVSKSIGKTMLDLPDCVSLSEKGGCGLLRISKCQGINCNFKKSKIDTQMEQAYWMLRLSSLDIDKQIRISKIYYDGKMPWNK